MRAGAAWASLVLAFSASGCAHHASDRISEPWRFEAQTTRGEVRVLPVLDLHQELEVELGSFVGLPVPYERERMRAHRTEQLERVPEVVAQRLPGAVNGRLGRAWKGQFHHDRWPMGGQDKLRQALTGELRWSEVDRALGELASSGTSEATLITWVRDVEGDPVSLHGFPGAVVDTPVGPVHVNHRDEPYVVTLGVGLALVSGQGEVLIRYEHDYTALMAGNLDDDDAASDLARSIALDVTKVWATEADLGTSGALLARESW